MAQKSTFERNFEKREIRQQQEELSNVLKSISLLKKEHQEDSNFQPWGYEPHELNQYTFS